MLKNHIVYVYHLHMKYAYNVMFKYEFHKNWFV